LQIARCSSAARDRCLAEVLARCGGGVERHRLLIMPYGVSLREADGLDLLEFRVHHEGAEAVGFLSLFGARTNDHAFAVRLAGGVRRRRMEKFTVLEGVAAPLRSINVDTDAIIPKQYLKTIKRTGLGKGLFAEKRYRDDGSDNPD